MLKQCPSVVALRLVLLALAWLLAACGGGAATSAPPTAAPAAQATVPAAPTEPAQPTPAAAPSAAIAPTPLAVPTAAAAPSAAPAPTAITPAGAAPVLIGYHKSGGIAGVDETLTVYADGTTEVRSKGGTARAHADPSTIQALQTLLASPEFAALQIPVQPPAADQFVYELTLPGRPKPLVVTDSADNPQVLRTLIDMLEQLKTQARQ